MIITILTQTREKDYSKCRSISSIINYITSDENQNKFNLIINHQVNTKSKSLQTDNYDNISSNIGLLTTNKISLSRARNKLLDISINEFENTNFFIIIDDDVRIKSLENVYKILNDNTKSNTFDFGSGLIFFEESNKPFSRHTRKIIKSNNNPFILRKQDHNIILGSSIILGSNIIKEGIRFDEKIGLGTYYGGSEETDIFLTIIEKGYKCIFFPNIIFSHIELSKTHYNFGKMLSYGLGRGYTYRKHLENDYLFYIYNLIKSLLNNFLGFIYYLSILKCNNSLIQLGLFIGKIIGFLKIKYKQ
tara:strand:+ start:11939 stop:12850 length:912 start_codon:yes stop_codon:yes gene_type:complete